LKRDQERFHDILEAIGRIEKYAKKGRRVFEQNELIETWVVHNLQIIGEAARKLSDDSRAAHPEIPWPQIIAMRNILVHDYFGVDINEVWAAVEKDLPVLKRQITAIAKKA
jgi:uncharacterized protein with HEPN domain